MKKLLIVAMCLLLISTQVFGMGSKEAGTATGVVAGGVAGTGVGAGIGAGVGAVVGSLIPVPGVGTAVGATFGAKVGGLVGALVGGSTGGVIGNGMSGSGTEYINVDTNFVFAFSGSEDPITSVSDNASSDGNYTIGSFELGKDIYLTIEMRPSLIEDVASKVSNAMKSKEVNIPVTLIIDNTDSIEVTNSGGILIDEITTDVTGVSYASFNIKLDPDKLFPVTFKISPAEEGSSRFSVIYGTDDNPIVSLDCNRTFLIDFHEPTNE